MVLLCLAVLFAESGSWLAFPGFALQSVAGIHMFVAVLTLPNMWPGNSHIILGALLLAFNGGGSVPQFQRLILGEPTSSSVKIMFIVQGIIYAVITVLVSVLFPRGPFSSDTGSFKEDAANSPEDDQGAPEKGWSYILRHPSYWGLVGLTLTVGVHVKWMLSELDYVFLDRGEHDPSSNFDADSMAQAFLSYQLPLLAAAYMSSIAIGKYTNGNLNIALGISCVVSIAMASISAWGNLASQVTTFVFLPILWQYFYATLQQYLAELFPNGNDEAHAYGLVLFIQGIAMFLLTGLHAIATTYGYTVSNAIFAVLAVVCFVVLAVCTCSTLRKPRNEQKILLEP